MIKGAVMTQDEIDSFTAWHEKRLSECGYPAAVCTELRRARDKWMAAHKVKAK